MPALRSLSLLVLVPALALGGAPLKARPSMNDASSLKKLAARLRTVDVAVDLSKLAPRERAALAKIVQAASLMDPLFLRQSWTGNEALLVQLAGDGTPLGRARLHSFLQNKGPWLRVDDQRSFLPGVGPKPAEGSFYPAGSTREEVERWLGVLPEAERSRATGFFTTLRRGPDGKWVIVPYSVEYQGELAQAASLLRQAAALTQQPTLKDFLEKRAAAFLSNDYYDSDVAWMKLDASLEPTIGPYEVYEDGWFNFKAAFEAFVTVRDDAETQKLERFSAELQDIENHLPIAPALRNSKLGALAPIRVVNSLFSAGDANRGVQTAAYNLPNDEKIGEALGTKRTMLKNIQEAKFREVLRPIAGVALAAADQGKVQFEPFFTHILMHELMHGLGPHGITVAGKATTVRAQLQSAYSAIEEAKADVSGLFALQHLIDKGVLAKDLEQTMYVTFLASAFRSIRFGLTEAHGKGIALQLNWLLDAGAFRVAKDGTFSVDAGKVKAAVAALTGELMSLQAAGDKAKADELLGRLGVVRPEVKRVLDRLLDVPVDIEPRYVTAAKLLAEIDTAP
jgi:hypothetical protein